MDNNLFCDTEFFVYRMPPYKIPKIVPEKPRTDMWWGSGNNAQTPNITANPEELTRMQKMFLLRDKILQYGGNEVCMPIIEEDYTSLMERGTIMPLRSRLMLGRPSRCHENASLLWDANPNNTRICTGYALSADGLWRQHSWVMHMYHTPKGYTKARIVETTAKRVAYFGIIFSGAECSKFYYENT